MPKSAVVQIIAIGVVMLVIGVIVGSLTFARTDTTTNVLTTTSTVFKTVSIITSIEIQNSTNLSSLCPSSAPDLNASSPYPYGEGVQPISFHMNENASMFACVVFYYYNETAPITIDPPDYISLSGTMNTSTFDNALANFSLSSSSHNLTVGNNEGAIEGSVVTFLIHSKPVSNGTYNFNLAWTLNPGPYACALDYYLMVGNGIPNYSYEGSCMTMTTNGNSTIPQGVVFTKMIKVGNVSNSS